MAVSRVDENRKGKSKSKPIEWEKATRAIQPKGGGLLTMQGSFGGSANGVAPSVFDSTGRIRNIHGGQFSGNSFMRIGLQLSDKERSERPFEENFVVRACLKAFSQGMASLPFQLWDGPPADDGSTEIETHPLLDLLNKPNRLQSGKELVVSHTTDFKLDGEVFWFLMNKKGEPVEVNDATGKITEFPKQILEVRGERVEHKVDVSGMPEFFRYRTGSQANGGFSEKFPWLSVVQFREYDPNNFVRGLGDVQALTREIDLMFQAYRYLDASVRNGGDPGGFIIYDESVGQDELDARQAELDETYGNENAGRYRILDRKAKFIPNPTTPKDMEYMSLFEWSLKAICSGIGVPPPIIGFLEDATLANYDSARREMWAGANGILAHAAGRQDVMRTKLIDRLDGTPEMRGQGMAELFPFFNPSQVEVLKRDRTDQLFKAAQIAGAGVGVSYNEALKQAELNVEPAQDGDTAFVHSTLRESGDPSPTAVAMEVAKKGGIASKGSSHPQVGGAGARSRRWVKIKLRAGVEDMDPEVERRALKWLDSYESNIIARLRIYANGGRKPSARKGEAYTDEDRSHTSGLTNQDIAFLVLNEKQWAAALDRVMKVPIKGIWKEGLAATQSALGGPLVPLTDPRVVAQIAKQLLQLSEGVTSTTSQGVRSAILRVLADVSETQSLQQAIKENLPELTKELRRVFASNAHRAQVIAITETNRATNGANFIQMAEAGVATKRWRTTSSNPRPTHTAAQAQGAIPFLDRFSTGGLHPHDSAMVASEVVNCVCVLEAEAFTDDLLDD